MRTRKNTILYIFSDISGILLTETLYINFATCDFKIILYFCVDPYQKDSDPLGLNVTDPKPWFPHTDR